MKNRYFIAINFPQEIKRELNKVIKNLKQIFPEHSIKWVEPGNLHITLHFLGNLEEEKINDIKKELEKIVKKYTPVTLQLKGVDTFPNKGYAKIIYIQAEEVSKGGILQQLVKEVGGILNQAGVEIDQRPWRPHSTLGRVKRGEKGLDLHKTVVDVNPLQFQIKHIDLMISELHSFGPVYSIDEKYEFKN